MKTKYEQVAVYMSKEEKDQLKAFAAGQCKSVAHVVYEAVKLMVGFKEVKKEQVVENVESGTVSAEGSDSFP